jgi:signal transduction histidine kinase
MVLPKTSLAEIKPQQINKDFKVISINSVYYCVDSLHTFSPSDVLMRVANNQVTLINNMHNFGRHTYSYWVVFKLENASNEFIKNGILKLEEPFIDQANCYILDENDTQIYHSESGRLVAIDQKSIKSRFVEFPVEMPAHAIYTYVLEINNAHSNYKLRFAASLYNPQSIYTSDKIDNFYYSTYLGTMLFVCVLSILLFYVFNQKVYVAYSINTFLILLLFLEIENYITYIPFTNYAIDWRIIRVTFIATAISYIQFSLRYLLTSKFTPLKYIQAGRVLTFVGFVYIILCVISFDFEPLTMILMKIDSLYVVITISITYVYIYYSIKNKYVPAQFFLVANLPIALVSFVDGVFVEIFGMNIRVEKLGYWATVFEVFILTLGLVYRFKVFQEQKESLQREIYEHQRKNFETQLQIQEQERVRIARSLHDSVGGILSALRINFEVLRKEAKISRIGNEFDTTHEMLGEAIKEVRRVSHEIMPSVLVRFGIEAAVRQIYEKLYKPKVDFTFEGLEERFELPKEVAIYRIVQELMTNVIKHSEAENAFISIIRQADYLELIIKDDGKGFVFKGFEAPQTPHELGSSNGMGLENVRSRVEYLQGKVDIRSAKNQGTNVVIEVNI